MTVISQVKSRTGSCFKTEAVTGSYPKFKIQPTPSYAALMAVFALGKSPGSNAICLGRVGQVCLETERVGANRPPFCTLAPQSSS